MVLGKEAQYTQAGKLKNSTILPKYSGEMELENILEDMNWLKLGACEIECLRVLDTESKKYDPELAIKVNERIKSIIKGGEKPKSEIDVLKEQIALLTEKVNSPAKEEKSESRIKLEAKANELNIKFRADISDDTLMERVVAIEPEFKL